MFKEWTLNPKQAEFLKSNKRYKLFSGGFGAGKTLTLELNVLDLLIRYPGNLGLLGRMTYQDLRDTVQKEMLQMIPKFWIKSYNKSERRLTLFNDSELLFKHLDKVSEQEIKSLNLGFFAIDQAEQVTEPVYLALKGRLRRKDCSNQGIMSSNPANTWLFREFKQDSKDENLLIETSTYDNKGNLPEAYIKDLEKYPDSWRKQFVDGSWDTAIMGDRNIYSVQTIDMLKADMIPIEKATMFDDIRIYEKKINPQHSYQMGVDTSEGIGGDASCLSVVNMNTGEEAAFWVGQMPPDILAFKAKKVVDYFNSFTKSRMYVVPEVNSMGVAFLNQFKKMYNVIYKREVFTKQNKERKEVLGWKTSVSTKPLLITNHIDLIRHGKLKIHTPELLEQMKTFVYTDEVAREGMGADVGFHDDAVIAHSLACFFAPPVKMRLLSSDKLKNSSSLVREAYNPQGPGLVFEKPHYDWMTDSNTHNDYDY